ncbi:MAG: BspA family leucine-rich repeat surface protein, partial [Luminiphilus sp.]|nr:BspA family leucine-rich repeat surface protein [Luminiphilus sp.]
MLRVRTEHPFRGLNSQHPTATRLVGSCLPKEHAAQYFLNAFSAATHPPSLRLGGPAARIPALLKRLITRLASVLVVTLCPALIAQAQVNVDDDLISFARWKKGGDGSQSLDPLYTLTQTGGFACKNFNIGQTTKTLSLETQLNSRNCQIGEGTGTGNKSDWDQMLKLTWKTKEACLANTQLLFGGSSYKTDGVIEVDYHSGNVDCNESPHTRNFALPALSRAQVNDGKIKVALGMDTPTLQDKVIGYWTLPTPECSDVTDWNAAATTPEWTCLVDGQEYEYADFHILRTDGTAVCPPDASNLLPNYANDLKFCKQTDDTLRAIFSWYNQILSYRLEWLLEVKQIGSRRIASDEPCEAAKLTAGNRCANQLAAGESAFYYMAGEGGLGIRNLDVSNLTGSMNRVFYYAQNFNEAISTWDVSGVKTMSEMFKEAGSFNQDIGDWDTSSVTTMERM